MRLIDADRLIKVIEKAQFEGSGNIMSIINDAPTVTIKEWKEEMPIYIKDAMLEALRPQGEWIKHIDNLYPEDSTEECPFCHEEQRLVGNDDNFCPNCGADMRGGAE